MSRSMSELSEQVCAEHSPGCAGLDSGAKAPPVSAILTAEAGKLLFVELPQPKLGEITTSHLIAQYRLAPLYLRNAFGDLSFSILQKNKLYETLFVTYKCKTWSNGRGF